MRYALGILLGLFSGIIFLMLTQLYGQICKRAFGELLAASPIFIAGVVTGYFSRRHGWIAGSAQGCIWAIFTWSGSTYGVNTAIAQGHWHSPMPTIEFAAASLALIPISTLGGYLGGKIYNLQ